MPKQQKPKATSTAEKFEPYTPDQKTNGKPLSPKKSKNGSLQSPVAASVSPYPQKHLSNPMTVGVIGAGFNGGQPRGGVEQGPARLLEYGLLDQLRKMHWKVEFDEKFKTQDHKRHNDADDIGNLKNARIVSKYAEDVRKSVEATCRKGHLALTLGGDHSIGMGTVSGSAAVYPDLGVIWVDAHADINTPDTTESGNLHGCPVSFLMGLVGEVESFEWLKPCLAPNRIVYIGLRDLDEGEKIILKKHNIKCFTMHSVDRYGIGQVMELAMDYLGRDKPIHLSYDVDGMDPTVAPATGTPVRGGLTFREGHYICEMLHEIGNLVAVDVVEVNPELGDKAMELQTIQIGCSIVRAALGETLL